MNTRMHVGVNVMETARVLWSGRWRVLPLFAISLVSARLDAQRAGPAGVRLARAQESRGVPPRAPDAWFGQDKVRHLGSSASIQLMGYGGMRVGGASRHTSTITASVVTAAVGVGKELFDARRGRQASWRDLTWDGAGLVVGTALARIGDPR